MSKNENQTEDNDIVELENQFILRFPKDLADEVRESVETGNIHEKLTIQLDSELRYGEVCLNDQLLHAKFVDLPTIVESYKTADNINLYKTADISQMLVCSREPMQELEKEEEKLQVQQLEMLLNLDKENKENKDGKDGKDVKDIPKVDEKFLWAHGLTPPTRNLRRRRIVNAMKGKISEPPEQDILKEVKYLLRMDSEAVRIDYEVVDDDGKPDEETDGSLSDEDLDELFKKLF